MHLLEPMDIVTPDDAGLEAKTPSHYGDCERRRRGVCPSELKLPRRRLRRLNIRRSRLWAIPPTTTFRRVTPYARVFQPVATDLSGRKFEWQPQAAICGAVTEVCYRQTATAIRASVRSSLSAFRFADGCASGAVSTVPAPERGNFRRSEMTGGTEGRPRFADIVLR